MSTCGFCGSRIKRSREDAVKQCISAGGLLAWHLAVLDAMGDLRDESQNFDAEIDESYLIQSRRLAYHGAGTIHDMHKAAHRRGTVPLPVYADLLAGYFDLAKATVMSVRTHAPKAVARILAKPDPPLPPHRASLEKVGSLPLRFFIKADRMMMMITLGVDGEPVLTDGTDVDAPRGHLW
jgi:hypothetical protein